MGNNASQRGIFLGFSTSTDDEAVDMFDIETLGLLESAYSN